MRDLFDSLEAAPGSPSEAEAADRAGTTASAANIASTPKSRRTKTRCMRVGQAAMDLDPTVPADQAPELLRERIQTAGDALAQLDTLVALSASAKADATSAVRTLSRACRLPPSEIGLAPHRIRPLMAPVIPSSINVSAKRWANARSAIRNLARATGHHAPLSVTRAPLPAEWEALVSQVKPRSRAAAMRGFLRHCDRCCVALHDVGRQEIDSYHTWLAAFTYEPQPARAAALLRAFWNSLARSLPGWPKTPIAPAPNPRRVSLPDDQLPLNLRNEIAAYRSARVTRSLDVGAAPISQASAFDRAKRLRFMASVLIREGKPASDVSSLEALLTPENLKTTLRFMLKRSTKQTFSMNERHVATAVVDAARHFAHLPPATVKELGEIKQRLGGETRGLSARAETRLKPFDSATLRARLFAVPDLEFDMAARLMRPDKAKSATDSATLCTARSGVQPVRAAQHHERGLAILTLLEIPMRRRTLVAIDINEHLQRDERGRITRLRLPGALTKNGVAIDAPLSPELAKAFERHISVFRPLLREASESSFVFPGLGGRARHPQSLARLISQSVEQHVGVTFNVSMFRHLAAAMLYESSPNAGPIAQRLLGHTSLTTTETMYGARSTRSAHATWSQLLQNGREQKAGKVRRPRYPRGGVPRVAP